MLHPTEMEVERDDEKFEKIGLMILERRRLDFKNAA
jgi:hypothetical protein